MPTDDMDQVCDAPYDKSGVFIIYARKGGRLVLVLIGSSGEMKSEVHMIFAKQNLAGLGIA